LEFIIFEQGIPSKVLKEATFDEPLEVPMQRTARAKGSGDRLPLTTGAEDIEDTIENLPPREGRTAALAAFVAFGQTGFKPFPQGVRNAPAIIDRLSFHPCTPCL
jgi:hypothetical protein